MNKILVVIPGYYERFQINTIESAIKRAKNPEQISFAIAHHEDHIVNTSHINNKVHKYIISKDIKVGVNKPRSILSKMKTDEDFILFVDSHVIFMKDWDEELILDYTDRVNNAENKKIIISGSFGNTINIGDLEYSDALSQYFNNNEFFNEKIDNNLYEFYIDKGKFEDVILKSRGEKITTPDYQGQMRNSMPMMTHHVGEMAAAHIEYPKLTNIFSAGFAFFPAKWFDNYSISQKIFFSGDQEETAINIYTTGYDVWMPRKKYHIHMADHKKDGAVWFEYEGNNWSTAKYFDIAKDQAGLKWFLSILQNMRYDDNIIRERTIQDFFNFHKLDRELYR